jgi:tRNA(fMet)-specific endonuclease VapC
VNKFMKMTGNNFLLDTNILTALFSGDSGIADKIDKANAVYIPVIAAGELYYGAAYSAQVKKNLKNLVLLTGRFEVLNINQETAQVYGTVKSMLRKKGRPIPENDIWIAAISLVTQDKHFKEIDGLSIKYW